MVKSSHILLNRGNPPSLPARACSAMRAADARMRGVSVTAARGTGYWTGIDDATFVSPWPQNAPHKKEDKQIPRIRRLVRQNYGAEDPALWDSKFKKRFAQSVRPLIAEHCGPRRLRFLSEAIVEDRPCKLFADLEFEKEHNPARDVVADTQRIAQRLGVIVASFFPGSAPATIELYASKPRKGSVHVTWQVVFENIRHVKAFVDQFLVPRIHENAEDAALFTVTKEEGGVVFETLALDLSVYRPGIFRTYGGENPTSLSRSALVTLFKSTSSSDNAAPLGAAEAEPCTSSLSAASGEARVSTDARVSLTWVTLATICGTKSSGTCVGFSGSIIMG